MRNEYVKESGLRNAFKYLKKRAITHLKILINNYIYI